MPELPEVETVVRQLGPCLTGQSIRQVDVEDPRLGLGAADVAPLAGQTVRRVFRLGKQIVLRLAGGEAGSRWVAIHLRMTGRLIWRPVEALARERRHRRLVFQLAEGLVALFDPRRFATVTIERSLEPLRPAGLDPLHRACTLTRLTELLAGSAQELKPWLLRQDRLVGLGNIYASEIPFAAGLSPFRPAGQLTGPEILRLHAAIRRILRQAIDNCGTTFSDFQYAAGVTGRYQQLLAVYGREACACPSCRTPIVRVVQQQRSTFFCPRCQAVG